jgi:hypothetical protein
MACVHNLCANQGGHRTRMPFKDEAQCERWLILLGRSGCSSTRQAPKLKQGSVLVPARPHF